MKWYDIFKMRITITASEHTHRHTHTQKKDTAATTGETSVQTSHSKQLGGNNTVW